MSHDDSSLPSASSNSGAPVALRRGGATRPPSSSQRAAVDRPLGTAEWMQDEAAAFAFDDRLFFQNAAGLWEGKSNGQIWIGETTNEGGNALGYSDDRHVCLVSGSRAGKGAGVIVPNLCLWPGSCFVIDPKGENATITARRRGQGSDYCYGMDQTVRILDPFGVTSLEAGLKARFNPMDVLDAASEMAVPDAGRIAASIVAVEGGSDRFFEEATRGLIKALILHVLTDDDFAGRRNLVSVWKLLHQGDWINHGILRKLGEDKIPSPFNLLWEGMINNTAFDGFVSGVGQQFVAMAERQRDGILHTARTHTEFIADRPMQRLLEASDFELSQLKTDPHGLSLYLVLPQRFMTSHYRWLRLMTDLAIGEMERISGKPASGFPTLFLLDEFAGLKRMEVIENAAAQAAGFGVKFFFVVQNLTQIKETYKDSWETFLGNSGLKLFFHVEDDFTRSYLSRQLGEHEVARKTRSGSESHSTGKTRTKGTSDSTTRGTSTSVTEGTSHTDTLGENESVGHSTSRGGSRGHGGHNSDHSSFSSSTSWGRSRGISDTRSRSIAHSNSRSHTDSRSSSVARSSTESETIGWSNAIHKRWLLNPDEIGRLLARIDDPMHGSHPGLIAALIPGQQPVLARRVNYFRSARFIGLFDPHPDHPYPPPLAYWTAWLAKMRRPMPLALPHPKPEPARPPTPKPVTPEISAPLQVAKPTLIDICLKLALPCALLVALVVGLPTGLEFLFRKSVSPLFHNIIYFGICLLWLFVSFDIVSGLKHDVKFFKGYISAAITSWVLVMTIPSFIIYRLFGHLSAEIFAALYVSAAIGGLFVKEAI